MLPGIYGLELDKVIMENNTFEPNWQNVGKKKHYYMFELDLPDVKKNSRVYIDEYDAMLKKAVCDDGKITVFANKKISPLTLDIYLLKPLSEVLPKDPKRNYPYAKRSQ